MARSEADLVNRVGSMLGLVATGESLTTADYALIEDYAEEVWAELSDQNLAPFPISDIPRSLFGNLAGMVAARAGVPFGDKQFFGAFDQFKNAYMQALSDRLDRSPTLHYEFC